MKKFNDFIGGFGETTLFSGTVPAAGNNYTDTLPTTECWWLYSFTFQLACDANAANRTSIFRLNSGASIIACFAQNVNMVANTTYRVSYCPISTAPYAAGALVTGQTVIVVPFDGLLIPSGAVLNIEIPNKQAGDAITSIKFHLGKFGV